MAREYDKVIEWISKNYSPKDFGISEEQLKEKLIIESRYNFDEEIDSIKQRLHDENKPNFSYRMLNALPKKEVYNKLISSDLDRIKSEAITEKEVQARKLRAEEMKIAGRISEEESIAKKRYDSGEKLSRQDKDILLEVFNINVAF